MKNYFEKNGKRYYKKKINLIIFIFLFALLSVFGLRIINQDFFYVSVDHVFEYKDKITEEELYIGDLKKKIEKTKREIEEHKDHKFDGKEKKLKYKKEIEKYKELAGFSALEGEGVIIIVDDGIRELVDEENPLNLIVHDVDVRNLINELRNAGAEAISINGNRIIMGISEVVCNGPTIRINGIQQSRPYVIKAIGDKYTLAQKLLDHDSYGVNLMKYGIQYELITSSKIEIDGYRGTNTYKYGFIMEE